MLRALRIGLALAGSEKYDIVIACGLFKTLVAGQILALWTGARLLVEVPVIPSRVVLLRDARTSPWKSAKAWMLGRCAATLLRRADHIKWIFPGQAIAIEPKLASRPATTFPDFVAVDAIAEGDEQEDAAIVLLGTPLYLKGADIAIRALQALGNEHPTQRLRLVGSSAGFDALRPLIRPGDPIELVDYLSPRDAIRELQRAKIVIIPSRTDAMPRVAVEAMAAGKPIVAARVDGMAIYLRDSRNCLLVEPLDPAALAAQLRRLLSDAELRRQLGVQARSDARKFFGGDVYARYYERMLVDCVEGRAGAVFDYH